MRLETQVIPPLKSAAGAQQPIDDILLIHGMGSASTAWQLLIPQLRRHFRVITVDLPGHGKTPFVKGTPMDPIALSDMVRDAVDDVSTGYHLVGNSLGGWVSLELADRKSVV